jgi:adenylate cyclase
LPHVFVSYARSTLTQAEQVAKALRALGHEVWRDDQLPAHRTYSEVIEERLRAAGAVIVLWSAEAVKSQWVRAEADAARGLGTLVQASVDGTVPPMPFNQVQCADLADWDGDTSAPGWRKVEGSVTALIGPGSRPIPSDSKRDRLSICVLPFANMSGDAEQEYFSDGISEDITTDLSHISALAVVARNTAFTFKGKAVDVAQVARQLNVSHVLEGSVRKAGQRVRITAQLIDGASGDHLWAERYDRDLTDIFAIQDEISKAIVSALELKLLPEEKKAMEQRGTTSAEAYNLYLMARQFWITGNHGDRRREERVIRICRRATEIDPNYARAWALMGIAQANLRFGFGQAGDDGLAAAERALSLDPTIAEAYCATARHHSENGRFEQAVAEFEKGLRLDPESWELNKAAATLFVWEGKVAEATTHFEKAVSAMESDYHGWGMLQTCYEALGDSERSKHAAEMTLEQAKRVLAEDPSNGAAISFVVSALAALGETARAKEWMERALLIDPDNLNMRYNFACTLAKYSDDADAALEMLESSLTRVQGTIGHAEHDPDLERIRDDPRCQKIIADAKARLAKSRDAH